MWGIEFREQREPNLPLITSSSFIILALSLLVLRISLQYFLENCFNIRQVRKEHSPNGLEFSYFYHLSIIILGLSELNWNLFDLCIWVFSYVCVGMLRKAIYTINVEREFLINDYAYNNTVMRLLINSIMLGVSAFCFGICYILFVNVFFAGIPFRVLSMLCFPSILLVLDSIYLFKASNITQKHLIYFYNQNINGISPLYKVDLFYTIAKNAIKCIHFFNLVLLCSAIILEKIDFLDCMWIVSVIGAFYRSSLQMITSIYKYKQMQKLLKSVGRILRKANRENDKVCIICMENLLNSHQLIQCGHSFHYKCLLQWIQTKEECPVCRVKINLNI